MSDSEDESEYKDTNFINVINKNLSKMSVNRDSAQSEDMTDFIDDTDFVRSADDSYRDVLLPEDNEYLDIEMIEAINKSIETYKNNKGDNNDYGNNNDDTDEYFDPEMIEAMNKSSEFHQNEYDENIFQDQIEKALIESQVFENERMESIKKDRNQRLNHVIHQHIRYAPIESCIFENIHNAFKLFLDMDTDSIFLNTDTYNIFVEYLNSKKHRINSETSTYILENIQILV
jgi:hypothetical protein